MQFAAVFPIGFNSARRAGTWLKSASVGGLICFVTLAGRAATSDAGDYLIDVWTGEKGLPNSSVTSIAQTPDGYLWVGTYNGLARFDGQRFVKFDPDNKPALRNARVRRLFAVPDGTLWINTYDGSLTSYRDGQFQLEWTGGGSADANVALVSARSNQPTFLLHTGEMIRLRPGGEGTNRWETLHPPNASSGELCVEADNGDIWCRGRDQKLWRFTGGTFVAVATNSGLQGQAINCLQADRAGRIWVGTEREIARWDGTRFETMTPTNGEATLNVAFLYFSPNGDVWSVANDRVRKARGREWVLAVESFRGLFTTGFDRLGVQEDQNGGVWFYHYGRGIFHVRPDGRTRPMAVEENFPGEKVDCFFEDKEGNLWAGVDRGGLVRLREKRFSVIVAGDGVAGKAAVSVAEDRAGDIWIGTYGAGLVRGQGDEWQNFSKAGGGRRGFVFSVCPDAVGRLWMSAGEEDLFVHSNGVVSAVTPAVHGVKALLAARDGRLWIGTKSSLSCWTQGQVRQFQPADGIARNDVRALAEDAGGAIWAGAGDGTLYRVASNRVDSYRSEDQWAGQPIWSLLADADGTVWVGTFRGGLLRFRDGKFTRFTSNQGLPDDVICSILEDGNGRLWIGTQQGIFQVAKAELDAFAAGKTTRINCTAYGRYDGLPSLECSGSYQPSAWRASDGRLLFATLRGVVAVQPGDLAPNRLPPPVVIEEALVDGQAQTPEPVPPPTRGGGEARRTMLEVPPGKRQVEFHFTGLSFVSPDRVRFRYKLEGLDRDWIEAGTRRSAQYSFLRPGQYQFRVIACNNDGVWNEHGARLSLVVRPHFYETWWFAMLATVFGAVTVVLLVRQIFVRRLRKKLEQVERQRAIERDRARIAKDIHDDLGAGLTHISLLSELARRDTPQQITNHVGQISDMARELTRTMDEIVWAVDPQNDSLDSLVTYVSKFAQEYLTVAGIRCRLDVPAELPPYALPAEVRHNLFLAIKEALNNVVKHAHATEAWLRLSVKPDAFTVTIEDNGRGLAASQAGNGEAGGVRRNGRISSGHGLGNLEKRLIASGGHCAVTSEPGSGTRVEMTVYLSSARSPELVTGPNSAAR